MQLVRVLIQVTKEQKAKLAELKSRGYTASGWIRSLLDRELDQALATGQKER